MHIPLRKYIYIHTFILYLTEKWTRIRYYFNLILIKDFNSNPLGSWLDNPPKHLSQHFHFHQPGIFFSWKSKEFQSTDLCGTPGSTVLWASMRAASEGLALESEGEDAGLVQGGEARLGLTVLLNTRNVGPEPAVHLRPGYVLVTVPLRVSEVKNVLQKTISLLQIRNAHVTGRWALIVKNFILWKNSLSWRHTPSLRVSIQALDQGLPSAPAVDFVRDLFSGDCPSNLTNRGRLLTWL